jgi:hypothetical protein
LFLFYRCILKIARGEEHFWKAQRNRQMTEKSRKHLATPVVTIVWQVTIADEGHFITPHFKIARCYLESWSIV